MFDLFPFSSLAVPTFLLTSLIATEHGAGLYTELSTVTSNSFLLEKASHKVCKIVVFSSHALNSNFINADFHLLIYFAGT